MASQGTLTGWDNEMSALRRRRSEQMLRRTLRVVWAAGLIPFAVVAISLLKQAPQPQFLHEMASTSFKAPLGPAEAVVDRAGTHVAFVSGDADVQSLTVKGQQIVTETLDMPWSYAKSGGTMLEWVDINRDELSDLRVAPMLDEELMSQMNDGGAYEYSVPVVEFVQTSDGFKRSTQPPGQPMVQETRAASRAYVDGQTFQLIVEEAWRQKTQLVGDRGGRQMLLGVALQVSDLNGDGRDEILTCDEQTEECTVEMTYRIYSNVDRRFQAVWEFTTLLPDGDMTFVGDMLRTVMLADLDSDGVDEVVCGDPMTGEVKILRWQDPPLS